MSIAVHASGGYWSTWTGQGKAGSLMRVGPRGTAPINIVSGQQPPEASSIDGTHVYWGTDNAVMKAPIEGGATATARTSDHRS